MTKLEKIRDELASAAVVSEMSGNIIPKYYKADFKAGFDACYETLKPEIDELVKALEPFELITKDRDFKIDEIEWNFCFNGKEWREFKNALTKFKEFMVDL